MPALSTAQNLDWQAFLNWERSSRDTIDFKAIYVDVADDDFVAGFMLSEIIYWNLPNKRGESKLRIEKEGRWWTCISYEDWHRAARLKEKAVRRAYKVLEDLGLIEVRLFKFQGAPSVHVWLNQQALLARWHQALGRRSQEPPPSDSAHSAESKNVECPDSVESAESDSAEMTESIPPNPPIPSGQNDRIHSAEMAESIPPNPPIPLTETSPETSPEKQQQRPAAAPSKKLGKIGELERFDREKALASLGLPAMPPPRSDAPPDPPATCEPAEPLDVAAPPDPGPPEPAEAKAGAQRDRDTAAQLLMELSVTGSKARFLASRHSLEAIREQINALPYRNAGSNPAGMLIKAIGENWPLPKPYHDAKVKREQHQQQQQAEAEAAQLWPAFREKLEWANLIIDPEGKRLVKCYISDGQRGLWARPEGVKAGADIFLSLQRLMKCQLERVS